MIIFGGGAFERSLGLEGGVLTNEISALIKRIKRTISIVLSLCHLKNTRRLLSANQEGCLQ